MQRESFIFYKSFYEASKDLPDESRLALYDVLISYAINGVPTESKDTIANAMFILIKPQIDANNRKFTNGKNGGRPKKKTKAKPKHNLDETKPKPNVNDNVNVNVNVNDNDKNIYTEGKFFKVKQEEYNKLLDMYGERVIKDYIEDINLYVGSSGKKYKDYYLTILSWLKKNKVPKIVKKQEITKEELDRKIAEARAGDDFYN